MDGVRVTYGYDFNNQLVSEQRSGANAYNISYTYDPLGNRIQKSDSGALTTYEFNTANELVKVQPPAVQPTTNTYDSSGNLILENSGGLLTTYTWDGENCLTYISNSDGSNEQFNYSADGLRKKRFAGGTTTNFIWDAQNLALETDGTLATQAVYSDKPGTWGGKFSLRKSGASSFYVPDYQGHMRQLTDLAQNVSDALLVDAWGREIINPTTTNNAFKAFGKWGYYRDSVNRLYVRHRTIRSDLGRWISQDPLGLDGGQWNLYTYVGNFPTASIDPSGLQSSCGDERTDECKPLPQITCGCKAVIRAISGTVIFTDTYPMKPPQTLQYGFLELTVVYKIKYFPTAPGISCPPNEIQTKTASTSEVSSGQIPYQFYGNFWEEVGDPIPPNWSVVQDRWVETGCQSPDGPSMELGDEGFKFPVRPLKITKYPWVPGSRTWRDHMLIHPDGGHPGTDGCIGITNEQAAKRIRSCFEYASEYQLARMDLSVYS